MTKSPTPPKTRRKRRGPRRKRSGNYYFTKVHEDAIVEYARTKDIKVRTELYIKYIGPVFDEMVDKIIYTYKFTTLPNIDSLKEECKIWLTTILDKFDPSKGSKAFSYFSVVTKNWFIHQVKKNATKSRKEVYFEDLSKELENEHMSTYNTYILDRERDEFWQYLWTEIDSWDTGVLKENEKKVFEAVKILLKNTDSIEIFNKKAIYLYMREITGFNTKQIVNNLNKIRTKYKQFKKDWEDGKV
jgi:DNA-directed RNA polymerase specialized sigma subunit